MKIKIKRGKYIKIKRCIRVYNTNLKESKTIELIDYVRKIRAHEKNAKYVSKRDIRNYI